MHGVYLPDWLIIFEKLLISGIARILLIPSLEIHFISPNVVFLHPLGFDVSFHLNLCHDFFCF